MSNVNIADAIAAFTNTLNEQRSGLLAELEQLDSQRAGVVSQLGQIDRTMAALSGKPTANQAVGSDGPKRQMSEQGRENIRRALEARRLRLAGEAEAKAVESAAVPEEAPEEQSAAVQEVVAPAPAVKLTELEQDVLVGGILKNNFQDGAEGTQSIWSNQIIDNGATRLVKAKQLPGVVTSLVKKGLLTLDGEAVTHLFALRR